MKFYYLEENKVLICKFYIIKNELHLTYVLKFGTLKRTKFLFAEFLNSN